MPRIRIYVSYDGECDADLHDLLHSQSERSDSTFEFSGRSESGAMTVAWTNSVRKKIQSVDEVVVLCSENTNASERVAAELRIAQEEGKPYLLLWGRRELQCTKPEGAKSTDAMYSWTRDVLESQMSAKIRSAKPLEIPEAYKRP